MKQQKAEQKEQKEKLLVTWKPWKPDARQVEATDGFAGSHGHKGQKPKAPCDDPDCFLGGPKDSSLVTQYLSGRGQSSQSFPGMSSKIYRKMYVSKNLYTSENLDSLASSTLFEAS